MSGTITGTPISFQALATQLVAAIGASGQPFAPSGTVTLAALATPVNALLTGAGESALVYNATGAIAFVRFGADLTVSAALTDFPVPAGGTRMITCGSVVQSVAVILSSGTGSIYVSRGAGT